MSLHPHLYCAVVFLESGVMIAAIFVLYYYNKNYELELVEDSRGQMCHATLQIFRNGMIK